MSKEYTPQDEQRIRELTKQISDTLNSLSEPLRELFEDIYGGHSGLCGEEYSEILSSLVIIEQESLPAAEMKFKRIGEFEG